MSFEDLPKSANMMLLSRERFALGLDLQKKSDEIEREEKFMLERISGMILPSQYESSPQSRRAESSVSLNSLWDTANYHDEHVVNTVAKRFPRAPMQWRDHCG